jgi:hypothetical protein
MRVIPVEGLDLQDLDTLAAVVRLVPFEGEYIPHFAIMSTDDGEDEVDTGTLAELVALQDGLYSAANKIDDMLRFFLKKVRDGKLEEFREIAKRTEEFEALMLEDDVFNDNCDEDEDWD